jgi:hypothetical protein
MDNFDMWVNMVYGQAMTIRGEVSTYQAAVKQYYKEKTEENRKKVEDLGAKLIEKGLIK